MVSSISYSLPAGQYLKSHSITLGIDHPVVRAARPGDRVVLWARAQYPVRHDRLSRSEKLTRIPIRAGVTKWSKWYFFSDFELATESLIPREAAITIYTSPFSG